MTIKLRIKYSNNRQLIEVDDHATVKNAVQSSKIKFNVNGSVKLSLNDQEALNEDDKISDLGIVSGDLLYLLADANSNNSQNDVKSQEPSEERTVIDSKMIAENKTIPTVLTLDKCKEKLNAKMLLQNILEKTNEVNTDSDYVFLAVHAFFMEAGFHSNDFLDNVWLPSTWKIESMKLYKITYKVFDSLECSCDVTATLTGPTLFLTGALENDECDSFQMKIKLEDIVDSHQLATRNPFLIYKNLEEFKKTVHSSMIQGIISSVKKARGEIAKTLITIPYELQLRIAKYLQMKTVCKLAQVCKTFRLLCNDDELWKTILIKEFGSHYLSVDDGGASYKESVIRLHRARIEQARMEQERLRPRMPLRPEFEVPPDIINPPFQPHGIPGMIGGSYDLYPGGGFQPGGFPYRGGRTPNHPDLIGVPPNSMRRPPPGARYDPLRPYGIPTDDDDRHPQRPLHPDLMRRPRFGDFDRFGGGGFI